MLRNDMSALIIDEPVTWKEHLILMVLSKGMHMFEAQ